MIALDRADGIWRVTLDRADKANSLTRPMLTELADIAEAAAREARALVLTGAGDKVFSAGMDLAEAETGLATDAIWERVSGAIAALPVPSVAALNGTLAGGAFGMALACDIRIAVPHARFFYPVAKLGFLPQPSDPGRLARLVGPARAKIILVAAQKIDAAEACAWGLIDRVVAPEALLETATGFCTAARDGDRDHIAAIKGMIAADAP